MKAFDGPIRLLTSFLVISFAHSPHGKGQGCGTRPTIGTCGVCQSNHYHVSCYCSEDWAGCSANEIDVLTFECHYRDPIDGGANCKVNWGVSGTTWDCFANINVGQILACAGLVILCEAACFSCLATSGAYSAGCTGCIVCLVQYASTDTCRTHCEFISSCLPIPGSAREVCGWNRCSVSGTCPSGTPPVEQVPPPPLH
jgi:hypothetical protein